MLGEEVNSGLNILGAGSRIEAAKRIKSLSPREVGPNNVPRVRVRRTHRVAELVGLALQELVQVTMKRLMFPLSQTVFGAHKRRYQRYRRVNSA